MLASNAAACPACGAALAQPATGAETIFYPEAQVDDDPETEGWSSGTLLMRPGSGGLEPGRLRLRLQALLIRKGGPCSGERLTVSRPKTAVGREDAEITIDDPTLSGRHFVIEEQGQEFFLRDLESTNGTYLNGHPVRSAQLKSGDEIQAGKSSFVFSVHEVIPCD